MKIVYDDFIGIYENAYSDEYCDNVVHQYKELENAGFGWTRQDVQDVATNIKDNTQIDTQSLLYRTNSININGFGSAHQEFIDIFDQNIWGEYSTKYSILEGHRGLGIYSNKVQKIEPGQGYHVWHCETQTREMSNRVLSYILYLNDIDDGGETEFLYQSIRVKPKKGTFILFPATFTHTHRGNPPLSDTKYIMNGWVEF